MNNTPESRLEDQITALGESFALFANTAQAYPRELVRLKPNEIAFSAAEIVYHMLDVERLWQRRIRGVRAGSMTTFQQMDPDKEARERQYNEKSYENGVSELNNARGETYALVRSMTLDELLLAGNHTRYGEMNTYAILAKMEEHDRTHSAQLDRTLQLVRPS